MDELMALDHAGRLRAERAKDAADAIRDSAYLRADLAFLDTAAANSCVIGGSELVSKARSVHAELRALHNLLVQATACPRLPAMARYAPGAGEWDGELDPAARAECAAFARVSAYYTQHIDVLEDARTAVERQAVLERPAARAAALSAAQAADALGGGGGNGAGSAGPHEQRLVALHAGEDAAAAAAVAGLEDYAASFGSGRGRRREHAARRLLAGAAPPAARRAVARGAAAAAASAAGADVDDALLADLLREEEEEEAPVLRLSAPLLGVGASGEELSAAAGTLLARLDARHAPELPGAVRSPLYSREREGLLRSALPPRARPPRAPAIGALPDGAGAAAARRAHLGSAPGDRGSAAHPLAPQRGSFGSGCGAAHAASGAHSDAHGAPAALDGQWGMGGGEASAALSKMGGGAFLHAHGGGRAAAAVAGTDAAAGGAAPLVALAPACVPCVCGSGAAGRYLCCLSSTHGSSDLFGACCGPSTVGDQTWSCSPCLEAAAAAWAGRGAGGADAAAGGAVTARRALGAGALRPRDRAASAAAARGVGAGASSPSAAPGGAAEHAEWGVLGEGGVSGGGGNGGGCNSGSGSGVGGSGGGISGAGGSGGTKRRAAGAPTGSPAPPAVRAVGAAAASSAPLPYVFHTHRALARPALECAPDGSCARLRVLPNSDRAASNVSRSRLLVGLTAASASLECRTLSCALQLLPPAAASGAAGLARVYDPETWGRVLDAAAGRAPGWGGGDVVDAADVEELFDVECVPPPVVTVAEGRDTLDELHGLGDAARAARHASGLAQLGAQLVLARRPRLCCSCQTSTLLGIACGTCCDLLCPSCDASRHTRAFIPPHDRVLHTSYAGVIEQVVPFSSARPSALAVPLPGNAFVSDSGALVNLRLWLPWFMRCTCGGDKFVPGGGVLDESVTIYGLGWAVECGRPRTLRCVQCNATARFQPFLDLPDSLWAATSMRVQVVFHTPMLDVFRATALAQPSWGWKTSSRTLQNLHAGHNSVFRCVSTLARASRALAAGGAASVSGAGAGGGGGAAAGDGSGRAAAVVAVQPVRPWVVISPHEEWRLLAGAPRHVPHAITSSALERMPPQESLSLAALEYDLEQAMRAADACITDACSSCSGNGWSRALDGCHKLHEARPSTQLFEDAAATTYAPHFVPREDVARFMATLPRGQRASRPSAPCGVGEAAGAASRAPAPVAAAARGVFGDSCPHQYITNMWDLRGGERYGEVLFWLERILQQFTEEAPNRAALAHLVVQLERVRAQVHAAPAFAACTGAAPEGAAAAARAGAAGAAAAAALTASAAAAAFAAPVGTVPAGTVPVGAGAAAAADTAPATAGAAAAIAGAAAAAAAAAPGAPVAPSTAFRVLASIVSPELPWSWRVPTEQDIYAYIPIAQPSHFTAGLDFMCLLKYWLLKHGYESRFSELTLLIGMMHSCSHRWCCFPGMSFVLRAGAGWAVLEDCEGVWARIFPLQHPTRMESPSRRVTHIGGHVFRRQAAMQLSHASARVRACIGDERRALRELRKYVRVLLKVARALKVQPQNLHHRVDAAMADLARRAALELDGEPTRVGAAVSEGAATSAADKALLSQLGAIEVELSALCVQRIAATKGEELTNPALKAAFEDHRKFVLGSELQTPAECSAREAALQADHAAVYEKITARNINTDAIDSAPSYYLATVEAQLLQSVMARLLVAMGYHERMSAASAAKDRAAVVQQSKTQRDEMSRLWERVKANHKFCGKGVCDIVLPILNFSHPPQDTAFRLSTAFSQSPHASAIAAVGFMDVLAVAAGRLLRAWEERSHGKYALFASCEFWRKKTDEMSALVTALRAPTMPVAAAAAPVDSVSAPRVADYVATVAALQHPECRLALAQRAAEGLVRAHELRVQTDAAFAYVTSTSFTREALARRRGDQSTLSSWVGKEQGGGFGGVPDVPGAGEALAFGASPPVWAGERRAA